MDPDEYGDMLRGEERDQRALRAEQIRQEAHIIVARVNDLLERVAPGLGDTRVTIDRIDLRHLLIQTFMAGISHAREHSK